MAERAARRPPDLAAVEHHSKAAPDLRGGFFHAGKSSSDMPDQLLGWLAWACAVLAAAAVFLRHLTAFLDALNKAVVALTGVVVSSRALRDAARPAVRASAEPGRKAVEKRKRRSKRRPRPTDRP